MGELLECGDVGEDGIPKGSSGRLGYGCFRTGEFIGNEIGFLFSGGVLKRKIWHF